jgi:hypothetical protein
VRRGREGDEKLPGRRHAATSDLDAAGGALAMDAAKSGQGEGEGPLPKERRAHRTGEQSKEDGGSSGGHNCVHGYSVEYPKILTKKFIYIVFIHMCISVYKKNKKYCLPSLT